MNIFTSITPKSALLSGLLFAMGVPALAVPVTGTLGFSGTGSLFTYTEGGVSYIDFRNPIGGAQGVIRASTVSDDFSIPGINPGDFGTIRDMSTADVPPYAHVPVNQPVEIDDFLTFSTLLSTNFRLTFLPLANCTGGGTCIGPFQLLQNAENVSVSMNIRGLIFNDRNADNPDVTSFTGLITAQFLRTNVAAVIAAASSSTGAQANAYSGSITASEVPEPESITLISIGVLAMLLGGLRAKHKTEQDS